MILEQFCVTAMAVFCYLIGDESSKRAALIDPAGDHHLILPKLKEYDLTVDWIINTHGHWDHTAGNDATANETGAKILIHEGDAQRLKSIPNRIFSRFLGGRKSPDPVQLLQDGDNIDVGELSLKVIHTPGHSEGSICLYHDGNIFTGDTLFTEGHGRTDFPGGSIQKIMDSIQNKILSLPDDTIIWPGHNYGRFPRSTVREQKSIYL
ncbi:MBL fold metallo-hydrolase [candidate division CSSED10-310 bacterium]|uniref:MBL fold metallo-hydrolase n=1 Tax=candidate division CSSED10-310 bacterium TaxID=2855610 RepID=A0ABV6YWX6_UNCC1